jgi:hypothetical protein
LHPLQPARQAPRNAEVRKAIFYQPGYVAAKMQRFTVRSVKFVMGAGAMFLFFGVRQTKQEPPDEPKVDSSAVLEIVEETTPELSKTTVRLTEIEFSRAQSFPETDVIENRLKRAE